jgi:hypothetical protein
VSSSFLATTTLVKVGEATAKKAPKAPAVPNNEKDAAAVPGET